MISILILSNLKVFSEHHLLKGISHILTVSESPGRPGHPKTFKLMRSYISVISHLDCIGY